MAVVSDKTKQVVPSLPIRRNYHTRTYSGSNLLKRDSLNVISRKIHDSIDSLSWHLPRNINQFPILKPIERGIELKILDIVFGDDPLQEGLVVEDDNKKRHQLAQKNLKEALGQAGNKRFQLQERHDLISNLCTGRLKENSKNAQLEMNDLMSKFVDQWNRYSNLVKETKEIFQGPRLAELSLHQYQSMKRKLKDCMESIQFDIRQLEYDLESVEKNRVVEMGREITHCATQLKKLNFKRHDVIDEQFGEESLATNLTSIKNRERIVEYLYCLEKMMVDVNKSTKECVAETDQQWNIVRSASLMSKFQQELVESVQFNFSSVFTEYQTKFDQFLIHTVEQIDDIVHWNPFHSIQQCSLEWRKRASAESMEQQHTSDLFSSILSKMEVSMDQVLDRVSSHWIPLMKEVDQAKVSVMKKDVVNARKTKELMMGRQAAMSFGSKLARNNYVLSKIMELVYCFSVDRTNLMEYAILEPEVGVALKLQELKDHYGHIKHEFDKELGNEINLIRTETREVDIHKRKQRAKELLKLILDNSYEWYNASVQEVKSMEDKVYELHKQYQNKLIQFFEYVPKNYGEDVHSSPNYQELLFWPRKVEEWCVEQQNEKIKRLGELESKKKVQGQKKQVKIVEEVCTRGQLLDGSKLPPHPDSMLKAIELGLEEYHVLGHLVEFDAKTDEEVVEIKPIDVETSKKSRLKLKESLLKDAEAIWTIMKQKTNEKIHYCMELLERERIKKVTDYESKLVNLDEAVNFRIERLPQIHLQHQNEARFLVDAIQEIRDRYSNRMTLVFQEIKHFQELAVKDTCTRLQNCRTMVEINQLKEQFTVLVDRFHFDTSEETEKAGLEFDHGKKMLSKSRLHGNHSSAWLIIKESGAFDPATVTNLLDQFKQGIAEEVIQFQKEAATSIRNTLKEFEQYQQDWELVKFNQSKFRNLRTLLKSELLWCENKQNEFKSSVGGLLTKLSGVQTWRDVIVCIQQTTETQASAMLLARYLCCQKETEMKALVKNSASMEDWKAWKEEVGKKAQVVVSATTTPKTPKNTTSRVNSIQRSLEVRTVETRAGSGTKRSPKSVQTAGTTSTKLTLSTTPMLQPSKQTEKSFSSTPSSDRWDFQKHAQIDKKLDTVFSNWVESCRKSLLERANKDREVKLKEIQTPASAYIQMIDGQLLEFLDYANSKKSAQVKEFMEVVGRLNTQLDKFVQLVFKLVLEHRTDTVHDWWTQKSEMFMNQHKELSVRKNIARQRLNASMGHPANANQLVQLQEKAKETNEEMVELIKELKSSTTLFLENMTVEYLKYVQYLSLCLTELYNHKLYQEPPEVKESSLDKLEFASDFEDLIIPINKDKEYYEIITTTRSETTLSFLSLVQKKLASLDLFVQEQSAEEQLWQTEFIEKVHYIQLPFN